MRSLIFLCLLSLLLSGSSARAVEYLSGIEWEEPTVITPGASDSRPPSDAIVLFDGNDLSAWRRNHSWVVEKGEMIVGETDLLTKQEFGDCQLHVEWMVPKSVSGQGQGSGNSGVYFMPHYNREHDLFNKYELQILNSHENKTYFDGQAAAVYKQSPPMANAMRPLGEWNVYDIVWNRPRFAEDGELESPAYVTLIHNGVLVQNHFAMPGATCWIAPPYYEKHADRLPIGLQSHENPVHFRNIWVREIEPPVGKRVSEPHTR